MRPIALALALQSPMPLPRVKGIIERRLLVNFRADPAAVSRLLPDPFEPLLANGHAIVGICLIRLGSLRPTFLPAACGIRSENAAHRFAVHWTQNGHQFEGVYIPRRDSSSRLATLAGGRVFPGVHNHADFRVVEDSGRYEIEMTSEDDQASLAVRGRVTTTWPAGSTFLDLDEASEFFRAGSLGYSATRRPGAYDGLELRCHAWKVEPLAVEAVHSSFFEDVGSFPPGAIQFDCALLMRNIAHEWHAKGQMCCAGEPVAAGA